MSCLHQLLVARSIGILLLLIFGQQHVTAQDRCAIGHGTLFQWNGGEYVDGGPDLTSPLVGDRPDFTESSSTVGVHVAQLEFGYTYTYDTTGGTSVRGHSFPETLLRYGIFHDWLELRVGLNYAEERTRTGAASATLKGAEDLYLGFKIGLTPQDGLLPEMAIIPQATVPTGSAAFNQGEMLAGLNWNYGWAISDYLATAGSTQINRSLDGTTGNAYHEVAQSWTVAASLSDRVGAYTEWYALFPSGADTEKPQHYFNGGLTYSVSDNLQLDVRAGVGLNQAADDFFLGVGAVVRRW